MLGRLRKIAIITTIVAALVAIAAMTGCGSGDAVSTQIVGTVLHDGNHSPLEGIRVTDNTAVTTTGVDGSFTLAKDNSDAFTLYVLADGYEAEQLPVSAGEGVRDVGDIYLKPALVVGYGRVTGIVADAGRPVASALVYIGSTTAITDSEGRYTLYNVAAGYRTISASTGLKSGSVQVLVNSMQVTSGADIAVTTEPPNPI